MSIRIIRAACVSLCALCAAGADLSGQMPVRAIDGPVSGISYDLENEELDAYFADPPNIYRFTQYMNQVLAPPLTDGGVDSVVKELKKYGIGGVQISVSWFDNYLEDENSWSAFVKNLERVRAAGIRVSIHDEQGYPSGSAGGKVVRDMPESEAKGLFHIVHNGSGTGEHSFEFPAEYQFVKALLYPLLSEGQPDLGNPQEAAATGNTVRTQGTAGNWALYIFGAATLDQNTQATSTIPQFRHTGKYPSLLTPESTRRLMEITHENYARHIADIGGKVDFFYTGEPHFMTLHWKHGVDGRFAFLPWDHNVPAEFEDMHGYDIMPRLAALFSGDSDEAKTVRINYCQTIAHLFRRNYTGALSEWCERHGVKLFFQPLLEEHLPIHVICYGDMMEALRGASMPACDIPVPQREWGGDKWPFWMTKFPGSAAILENETTAGALIDPIVGGNGRGNLSPETDRMLRAINAACFNGVNRFATYVRYGEYPVSRYRFMNEYTGRLCVMLRGAQNDAGIAMYYPIETFQANVLPMTKRHNVIDARYAHLQKTLDELAGGIILGGGDFNYITPDAILKGKVSGCSLIIGGNRYRSVLMPNVQAIPLAVLEKLQECSDAGVKVYWVDAVPSMGVRSDEHAAVKRIAAGLQAQEIPAVDEIIKSAGGEEGMTVSPDGDPLSVGRYTRNGCRMLYIMNDSDGEKSCTVGSETVSGVKIYDPANGSITKATLPCKLSVDKYRGIIVMEETVDKKR